MAPPKTSISETELEVLKGLWEIGPCAARALGAALGKRRRKWAQTTLLTLLARLEDKGCVRVDRRAIPHVFHAAVTREKLLLRRFKTISKQLYDGSGLPILKALVRGGSFSAEDIQEFRDLLDELEDEKGRDD